MTIMIETDLSKLARPSGGFAMLAIDQRESMRAMFAEKQSTPVEDRQLTEFKLEALKALTPYASAVLIDPEFAWRLAIDEKVVAPNCGLIAAGDLFFAKGDEVVADVEIDETVVPEEIRADGGVAMKLLVVWRPDEPADKRIAMVDRFVERCRSAGLISVVEPVSRKARDGRQYDLADGIFQAARELGGRGADLYKAEVPYGGSGTETEIRDACAKLTKIIDSPWVVLSSGVTPDKFPLAVEWACREGARGFLAGRAVWRNVIGNPDMKTALKEDAVPRLQRLVDVVDRIVTA